MFTLTEEITEIDPIYHHLHHADVLKILERARISFVASIGYPVESFIERNQYLVIFEIGVKYLREVRLGQYQVTVEDCSISGKMLKCKQRIINSKGKDAVEATVSIMLLDGNLKRSVLPDSDFINSFTLVKPQELH